jgi:hypothetical protein
LPLNVERWEAALLLTHAVANPRRGGADPSRAAQPPSEFRARKTKEKGLHRLGFPWPIRAFSVGYSESKSKNHTACSTRL